MLTCWITDDDHEGEVRLYRVTLYTGGLIHAYPYCDRHANGRRAL